MSELNKAKETLERTCRLCAVFFLSSTSRRLRRPAGSKDGLVASDDNGVFRRTIVRSGQVRWRKSKASAEIDGSRPDSGFLHLGSKTANLMSQDILI